MYRQSTPDSGIKKPLVEVLVNHNRKDYLCVGSETGHELQLRKALKSVLDENVLLLICLLFFSSAHNPRLEKSASLSSVLLAAANSASPHPPEKHRLGVGAIYSTPTYSFFLSISLSFWDRVTLC